MEQEQSRRESLLLDAINPADGSIFQVQLSYKRLQNIAQRSLGQVQECGQILPNILIRPVGIFEGIRNEGDEDKGDGQGWLCYSGIPEIAFNSDGTTRPVKAGLVFLVFVNSEKVAYNWRWEEADTTDRRLPENHTDRFREKKL